MVRLLRPAIHFLTGAYALDALDSAAEEKRFERHLDRCDSCADEVHGLRETATMLGMAATREPPPTLRAVLSAVATTSQVPAPQPDARPQPRNVWVPRLAIATTAASVVAAVVLSVALVSTQRQLNHVQTQNRAIAAVLAARDARILTRPVPAGGTATLVVSPARREMIITTAGLPSLPPGKIYQLWLLGPPRTRSAGLLPTPQGSHTPPVLASGLAHGDIFAVTVEPDGGTAQPTVKPILRIALPG